MPLPIRADVQSAEQAEEMPQPAAISAEATEETEILHASIKAGSMAQIVVAVVAVVALCYLTEAGHGNDTHRDPLSICPGAAGWLAVAH